MGIRIVEALQLINILNLLVLRKKKLNDDSGIKICSLGYPDLAFRAQDLMKSLSEYRFFPSNFINSLKSVDFVSDLGEKGQDFVDPNSFFGYFDATFDVFDVCAHRGVEILVDLNIPNSTSMYTSRYDLVIDNGTLEHCFNVGEALINTHDWPNIHLVMCFILILCICLITDFDICPTFLFDFYHQNQFQIKHVYATGSKSEKKAALKFPNRRLDLNGYFGEEEVIMNFWTHSRETDTRTRREFIYPIQSKYKHIID